MVKKTLVYVFYTLEGIIFLLYMLADLGRPLPVTSGIKSSVLKYSGICLVLLGTAVLTAIKRNISSALLCAALAFTVFSDYFLLFSAELLPGICSFCVVQVMYMLLMLYRQNNGHIPAQRFFTRLTLVFVSASGICALLALSAGDTVRTAGPFFIFCILLYAALFISNLILSLKKPRNMFFTVGLFLFFLCDVNVLLFNLPGFFTLNAAFTAFCNDLAAVLMWFFYLPGKVFIFSSEMSIYNQ